MSKLKTVALDFDGVIHRYSKGWYDGSIYDEPMPGAVEGIRKLLEHPYAVFVFTSREVEAIMPWLERHGFDVTIDERCGSCYGSGKGPCDKCQQPHVTACETCHGSGKLEFWNLPGQILVTNRKLPAFCYVDDRAVPFSNWKQLPNQILAARDGNFGTPCCAIHGRRCEYGKYCCGNCVEVHHFAPNHGNTLCSFSVD